MIGEDIAHSAPRLRGLWPRLVTTGAVNIKKKPFERERSLCYESLLPSTRSRLVMGSCQTQVQVQNLFYDNCWEIRFMLSTQGASRAGLFFQPTVGAWNYFWTVDLCRILFLPMCTSRIYSVFFKITQPPHPTTASPPEYSDLYRKPVFVYNWW